MSSVFLWHLHVSTGGGGRLGGSAGRKGKVAAGGRGQKGRGSRDGRREEEEEQGVHLAVYANMT